MADGSLFPIADLDAPVPGAPGVTTRDLLERRADLALGDAEKDAWCAKWGRWHNGRLIFPQMIDGKTVYDLTD